MPTDFEATSYGVRITVSDPQSSEDLSRFTAQLRNGIGSRQTFGLLVDLRLQVTRRPKEEAAVIVDAMKTARSLGLTRSAVVASNAKTTFAIRQLAFSTGVYEWERYFDASTNSEWEKAALDWIENGTDPDL